jgi:hypothetical protein
MPFTFENLIEFTPTIAPPLLKQFKNRYIGFHMSLTFKSAHCVEASPAPAGLVGTIFLTFQVDTAAGFGETELFVTKINFYKHRAFSVYYTGYNYKHIFPIIAKIHQSVIDHFMITYDSDTRQLAAHTFAQTIREELCAAAFHPDRVRRLIDTHGIEALDCF